MSYESEPGSDDALDTFFDRNAGRHYLRLIQRMDYYVRRLVNGDKDVDVLDADTERIDKVGEKVAAFIIGEADAEAARDVQRSIRFGLQLSHELGGDLPGYRAGLVALEQMVERPSTLVLVLEDAYDRYLRKHSLLDRTLHENLKLLSHGHQVACQDVISFMLEQANRETYIEDQARSLSAELDRFLDNPPTE